MAMSVGPVAKQNIPTVSLVRAPKEKKEDESLIILYNRIPLTDKPILFGDSFLQADQIRVWMKTALVLQEFDSLDLTGAKLTMVPPEIQYFTGLQTLSLRNNFLKTIDHIYWPDDLRELDLSENQIETIDHADWPEFLKKLDLSSNQLISINAVGSIPRSCVVNAMMNPFSKDYIVHFMKRMNEGLSYQPIHPPKITFFACVDPATLLLRRSSF